MSGASAQVTQQPAGDSKETEPWARHQAGASAEPAVQQADPKDAEQNKAMAIIAYILFFIPLLTGDHKKSPFVKFHANQGTILFLAAFAAYIVSSMLTVVIIGIFLLPLCFIASLAFCIIGILNAVNGKMTPLPIIGKFTIIK